MDYRIQKTKSSICNAFIALRSKKTLEKITVKELCELARINKSTFYAHYLDIYDLSDKIESEITAEIMNQIDIEDVLKKPSGLPKELSLLWTAQKSLISIIFSGSRTEQLPKKVLSTILTQLNEKHPEFADNAKLRIMLTYCVYGGYYAFNENQSCSDELMLETLGEISARIAFDEN
ncbi:MAG: TetR/AcrR family transcriptional regulator [Oscillospiraceae bacterium]|nr:TetR/AcrR family transcriptional regulator [Oscillospiraceae bacterium]